MSDETNNEDEASIELRNAISLASTDDLVSEVLSRVDVAVVLLNRTFQEGDYRLNHRVRGNPFAVIGLLRHYSQMLELDLMADGEPIDDD